jgi:hypothetical protein
MGYRLNICINLEDYRVKRILLFGMLSALLLGAGCTGLQVNNAQPSVGIISPPPAIPGAQQGFSSSNPAAMGDTVVFDEVANDSGQGNADYSAKLTLLEVLRGPAALDKIRRSYPSYLINIQNDREFMLARFKYELIDTDPPRFSRLVNRGSFEIYRYGAFDPEDNSFIIGATPDFYGKANKGDVVDGWISFTVPKAASSPLIVFGRSSVGAGGVWFKTS